ncbi:MAG: flagellar basal body P-ring protein FlgI [Planctomycetota bacterium]
MKTALTLTVAFAIVALGVSEAFAQGQTRLANICRIKGQEENVLRGIGLVVGLNGTGEANDAATMRALSRSLELMGNPVTKTGRFDQETQQALRNVKNVALVMVTATVPATGARSGDKIDCSVSALNGKSLEGGRLLSAALQGPNTQDATVYALCEGPLHVVDPGQPMVANIHNGCQVSRDIFTPFVSEDGWVTIVLDEHHADFNVCEEVAEQLARQYVNDFLPSGVRFDEEKVRESFVLPIDAANIRVKVPQRLEKDPVHFVAQLLEQQILNAEPEARVVCDTRNGSVVISGDVQIGAVAFTHSNLMIQAGPAPNFLPISPTESQRPKLDRLVQALKNLQVPGKDVIEIIRSIERAGKLHAKLIVL